MSTTFLVWLVRGCSLPSQIGSVLIGAQAIIRAYVFCYGVLLKYGDKTTRPEAEFSYFNLQIFCLCSFFFFYQHLWMDLLVLLVTLQVLRKLPPKEYFFLYLSVFYNFVRSSGLLLIMSDGTVNSVKVFLPIVSPLRTTGFIKGVPAGILTTLPLGA